MNNLAGLIKRYDPTIWIRETMYLENKKPGLERKIQVKKKKKSGEYLKFLSI